MTRPNRNRTAKSATAVVTAALMLFSFPAGVGAFGTINSNGQNAEHGRITRQALACSPASEPGSCFEKRSLDSLSGKPGAFGAVGAPDRGRGMLTSYAHCSGGDHLDIPGYPQSEEVARATLEECRTYMMDNLTHAVADASALLDDDGAIRLRSVSMTPGCIYKGSKHGRAKCNILAHLGRILHAAQDFYTHSNWVDRPDARQPISAKNPPGLGNRGRAAWLDLRVAQPVFPSGLISGCFDNASFLDEQKGCLYGEAGDHRVRHANLNKDFGTIDPVIGSGTTERGALHDNFRYAVEAAIDDSADKWASYREMLVATYGAERGKKMICALTSDRPAKRC